MPPKGKQAVAKAATTKGNKSSLAASNDVDMNTIHAEEEGERLLTPEETKKLTGGKTLDAVDCGDAAKPGQVPSPVAEELEAVVENAIIYSEGLSQSHFYDHSQPNLEDSPWSVVPTLSDNEMQVEATNIHAFQRSAVMFRVRMNGRLTGQVFMHEGGIQYNALKEKFTRK